MSHITICYLVYLPLAIALVVWVARVLFKNGKVFLADIFHGHQELATAVNNLLLTGFYLINIGYAVYTLQIIDTVQDMQAVIEVLSVKTGTIILILGAMHFLNMAVLFKLRKKATTPAPAAS